jgi:LL-diaminopimelate aminotransferase
MPRWAAHRLDNLPPYLFVEIDRKKRAAIAAGKDVINFGIGDPDSPTPGFIVDEMAKQIRQPMNHRYPAGSGTTEFKNAATDFMKRRFGVTLDPATHITACIGSKEAIGHLPIAVVNPGEHVLVPDPGYPVYISATIFAGGTPHLMPLTAENQWLPDFSAIPADVVKNAKLMYLNYPNNPTGAVADLRFYKQAAQFAQDNDILLAHDAAYSEMSFDVKPPSVLQVDGALDHAVEFHSLSKSFNMTGWRIGFVAGNPEVVAALANVKSNLDSGQFDAIQHAATVALRQNDHVEVRAMGDLYRERRDIVVDAMRSMGLTVEPPKATFYVWVKCPKGYSSMDFSTKALEQCAVVLIPGNGFGKGGEGYFRIALTVETERTKVAMDRLKGMTW